jgi:primosomal protein N'
VIVEVALVIPLRQIFDYKWPSGWNEPKLGQRVLVPFRRQKKCGLIVGIKEKTEFSGIRQILSLLDEHPIITRELLDLTRWVAQYYFCGWGEVLQAALPGGLGVHLQSEYSWETSKLDQSIVLPKKIFISATQGKLDRSGMEGTAAINNGGRTPPALVGKWGAQSAAPPCSTTGEDQDRALGTAEKCALQ